MNKKHLSRGILAIAMLAPLLGFGTGWAADTGIPGPDRQVLDASDIVASRGMAHLTVGLVDQEMSKMPDEVRSGYLVDPDLFGRLVDSLLLTVQLANEAKANGIHLPSEEGSLGSDETLDDLNKLANELLRRHTSERSDTDLELLARERYQARKSRYASEARYVVRFIHQSSAAQGAIAARIIMDAARERIRSGEGFESVAQEVDPGGEGLEPIMMIQSELITADPKLRRALAQLRDGAVVSDVLEDEAGGFYLYSLVQYDPPVIPPYEAVREQIVNDLRDEARSNERTTYLRSFSLQDFTLNNEVISALPARYQAMEEAKAATQDP